MEKKIAYERMGKFGKTEYLIPLKCLPLVQKKESEKAYCCGEYTGFTYKDGNPQIDIFGWIPKSQLVEIEGEKYIPAWIPDNWRITHLQFTRWINEEYFRHNGSWEVRKLEN